MFTSLSSSYLIIGAGVFGVSTAYHLARKFPDASVTLVDRDAFDADKRVAASWDWNKVVRADYDDAIYCNLALEAQDVFESDPLWKPYFHQTGLYWMCSREYAQNVIKNFRRYGRTTELAAIPVDQARKLYGGLFKDADYTGVEEVLVNKTSGWVAAGDCLRAVTRKCIDLGVKYVAAEVATLQVDHKGRCYGATLAKGELLAASHVILCTGAFTPKLLELSATRTGVDELRAGSRILAGGITTGMTKLDDESYAKFASMPVGIQGFTVTTGEPEPFMGSLPPTKDQELKWWGSKIFKNTQEVLPGRYLSTPPPQTDYDQWNVFGQLKEDIRRASSLFYGREAANWELVNHRVCWDAFTTSSDFIISPHAASKGLYVATCGSFHGYKFFPIIGKYVGQMLEGSLSPELAKKWAWNRERPDPKLNPDWPKTEMKDFQDPDRMSKL